MSTMPGDVGLSKCQLFGISPISRFRLWRRPKHIFDYELNYFEAIKKTGHEVPFFSTPEFKIKQVVAG